MPVNPTLGFEWAHVVKSLPVIVLGTMAVIAPVLPLVVLIAGVGYGG